MDLIEARIALPRLTRWVRALLLGGLEGLSVGIAMSTLLQSDHLAEFVLTNRIAPVLRKEMLTIVLLSAVLVPLAITVSCAVPKWVGTRLSSLERRARLAAPLCTSGFVPLVGQPTLWHDKPLAFLVATAFFSLVTVASVHTSLSTWARRQSVGAAGDFRCIVDVVATRVSHKIRSILASGIVLSFAWVSVTRQLSIPNLEATGIGREWSTIRHFSEAGGALAWFSLKGLNATGHASCLGAIYSLVAWFSPKIVGFLQLRLLLVSLAAVPLFFWCKKSLGVLSAALISLSFLSMPLPGMLGTGDAFPITCAMGCFFLSAFYLENGKLLRGLLLVLLGISINEQVAIWFSLLGVYFLTFDSRKALGRWLAIASACYFLTVALLVLPHYGIKTYLMDPHNVTSLGIQNLRVTLATLFANPAFALTRWFETQDLEYWLALCVPFAFLPFRGSLTWLAPALILASVVSSRESNSPWRDPAFGHFLTLGILATVTNLRKIRLSPKNGNLRYRAALVGWLAALLPCVVMFGSLFYRRS
jgi:hypothetical protein